ncbi:MAG: dethiobiotin synthase [Candidatus Eremiobacteraeota bacterium]|nr:dethiobiotin synthase [Candidatus Eremiobacteraeota bacterium]
MTGTDTGVGKTRVTAALARAARDRDGAATDIVKLVQTGLAPGVCGDAQTAAELAGCAWLELHRFALAADPWAAALAQGCEPLRAAALAEALTALPNAAIVEGSGGAAVPLNANESLSDAVPAALCSTILVIGLRLGCINHALLSLEYLTRRGHNVRGAIFCEAWNPTTAAYRAQVERAVAPHVRIAGTIAFDPDAARRIAADARSVADLVAQR